MTEETDTNVDFKEVAQELVEKIGPDLEAIHRFEEKEGKRIEGISIRLNELQALLDDVSTANKFQNPHELCVYLNSIFQAIDNLEIFVNEVKKRLVLLDKEVTRRRPSKLGKMFSKKEPSISFSEILFDTDSLMDECGLATV